jgi:acetyl/propionyl-CoA carboxylase alpha subunit/acetyl-CoA carboxylase carboxyltransferase component
MRTAAELGLPTLAIYSEDDVQALHTRRADDARALRGSGVRAYLDIEQILVIARENGCDCVHPGYGFLSENAAFARRCAELGLSFIGPRPEILESFGDKVRARALAAAADVPVLQGTAGMHGATSLEEARNFMRSLAPGEGMLIKAVAGGGGRGMRVVNRLDQLAEAYVRCSSEARAAFGNGDVYVECLLPHARHVEVQVAGDGSGQVALLGERDCSIQRRHQKLIEIAPPPGLSTALLERIRAAAQRLAEKVRYDNIGTFEFLVDASELRDDGFFAFIEANPRLQVEHTITEEVMGIDLVRIQLELASGRRIDQLGLPEAPAFYARGFAIQARVNLETMHADGNTVPSGGTLSAFDVPSGRGVRVDTAGYGGYPTSTRYDSLLAKVIAHAPDGDFAAAADKCYRALCEFRIEGAQTNLGLLAALLQHREFRGGGIYTRFIDDHAGELVTAAQGARPQLFFAHDDTDGPGAQSSGKLELAGARVDSADPLAVLNYGKGGAAPAAASKQQGPLRRSSPADEEAPEGTSALRAPLQGTLVSVTVSEGDLVRKGQPLFVMDAMKMEHEVRADRSGLVLKVSVAPGDTVYTGHILLLLSEREVEADSEQMEQTVDLDHVRPDLAEVLARRATTLDAGRPTAVAKRRKTGQRTARENIDDLCDEGSFLEYGQLVLAAQWRRRGLQELVEKSPADGLVTGIGSINGRMFAEPASRCVVMSYDYTVFAGTQGLQNHRKTDRMIDIAADGRMPLVLFAEGGGGRPGDTDAIPDAGGIGTFAHFATLSALVPMVGITSGRCFAGNASLLGCCDVIIATANANIGMGGPAMVEGGGLGVFRPEQIGPLDVQIPNGVVDIAVADEAAAVATAKHYLSFFQGPVAHWEAADQRAMRLIVPDNRLRVYDVRNVVTTLADTGSVLELRREFGKGMVTALARVEGRPIGVVANNPMHLGGAIDSDCADKAARFMQLCDAFDLPILFLCDTPGIMVGPEIEKSALVRHSSRMFLIGANLSVPFFTIVLRKSYGLGAIAMAGGSFKMPYFSVSWPTGEFGGMGLEGAVKLGYRNELAAIDDPDERKATYEKMVARAYEQGKALQISSYFGMDDTIDPADSRRWVGGLLRSVRPSPRPGGKKRPAVDAW